jgi:hypothetical protein
MAIFVERFMGFLFQTLLLILSRKYLLGKTIPLAHIRIHTVKKELTAKGLCCFD